MKAIPHPYEADRTSAEAEIGAVLSSWSRRQQRAVLERLGSTKTRYGTRHWDGDGAGIKSINGAHIVDIQKWAEELLGDLEEVLTPLAKKHATLIARELQNSGVIDKFLKAGKGNPLGKSALDKITGGGAMSSDSYAAKPIAIAKDMVRDSAIRQSQKVLDLITEMDKNGASIDAIKKAVRRQIGTRSSWKKGLSTAITTSTIEGAKSAILEKVDTFISKQWKTMHDEKTRPTHRKADGQKRTGGKPFHVGDSLMMYPGDPTAPINETANCFVADTIVDGVIDGAYRREYSGLMIEIVTREGKHLTGTPNHPILTDKGWIPLQLLVEGDNLFCYERNIESSIGHNINASPTQISKVFDTLAMSGDSVWVSSGGVNFHGEIPNGNVDVVFVDRKLSSNINTQADKFVSKFSFPSSNMVSGKFFTFGSQDERGISISTPPSSDIGISSQVDSSNIIKAIHTGIHSLTTISGGYIVLNEESSESSPTDIEFVGKELLGFPCKVSLDDVISVRRIESWSGHVYNLSTKTGAYTSNGIIAHNCRCWTEWSPAPRKTVKRTVAK